MKVSIIIPIRNEELVIKKIIDRLENKLINLPFGRKTPFTAEVWYINKTVKRDLKWGTPAPIQIMDSTLGFPVSARSFGKWGTRIENSRSFVTQIVGSQLTADDSKISDY